jgi:hypothetical protein
VLFIHRFVLVALVAFGSGQASAAIFNCGGLLALISSKKPVTRTFVLDHSRPRPRALSPDDLRLLAPTHEGSFLTGPPVAFRVMGEDAFSGVNDRLSGRGIWILFTPSPGWAEMPVGHFNVMVDGRVYSRGVELPDQPSIQSADWKALRRHEDLDSTFQGGYFVAQFFETTQDAVPYLRSYFDQRAATQSDRTSPVRLTTDYLFRPFSSSRATDTSENCVTFAFPWTIPRIRQLRPEMGEIERQLGLPQINELPSLQLPLNAQALSYRGTIVVARNPHQTMQYLQDDNAINGDIFLRQLLLAEPARFLPPQN